MNRKERGTLRIVHELAGMSIAELQEFWPHWDAAMKEMGLPVWAREFGRTAVKLVIEKKQKKQHYINA